MPWLPPAAAALVAVATALASGPVLRHLPEPDPANEGIEEKASYASLASSGMALGVGIASLVTSAVAIACVPPELWIAWVSLATAGVLAVAIDLRTTWLPSPLAWASWVMAAVGVVVAAAWKHDPWVVLWSAVGAFGLWAFFHAVWRITHSIGYGDVRLMATIGAVAGASDPSLMLSSALFGTLVGAVWGVAHRVRRGTETSFAYGPALLSGPLVAVALAKLTGV